MTINPDRLVVFRLGPFAVNETVFFTWFVMAVLVGASLLLTRGLSPGLRIGRRQAILEALLSFLEAQIGEVTGGKSRPFLPFLGGLFVFILGANLLEVLPLYHPPTASLSTTAALAACVFFAVPYFGISRRGLGPYLRDYLEPSPLMLPFTLISELSRTLSLAVRLFGNIMSEGLIVAVLLTIVPLFVPMVFQAFGLVIGAIQAFIFLVLSTVYIGAALGSAGADAAKEVR